MITQPISPPTAIGRDVKKQGWVQTDKKVHVAWAKFTLKKPTASALLHYMCGYMGDQNALVVSQSILAKVLDVSDRTISTAIADLASNQWIQIVRLGKGKECAYIVNDRVAWDKPRDKLSLSLFSATVLASADDQDELEGPALRRIPVMFPGERQLPTGVGESFNIENDMPAIVIDRETGEITAIGNET